jgi:hypothetical protein
MKHLYLLVSFLQLAYFPSDGQSLSTAFRGLSYPAGSNQTEASTFITMESIRHGMSAPLKGVIVNLNQNTTCAGSPAAILLSNPTGEHWKYAVFSASGQICSEGETGVERWIPLQESGKYLVRFTHTSGMVAFDELTVRTQPLFNASIEFNDLQGAIAGQLLKFKTTCPEAIEFKWDMGDGTVYHGSSEITHIYKMPGLYNVLLTANNWDCEATSEMKLKVEAVVARNQADID